MKNTLFVLFVFGLIILSGCGGNNDTPSSNAVNEELNKPTTSPKITEETSKLENARDSLEELKKTTEAYSKVGECARLCAGEDKDIPAVLDQCRLACHNDYYYGGEEALDELIQEFKNSS